MEWLRGRCNGVVILDEEGARNDLIDVDQVVVDNVRDGEKVRQQLAPPHAAWPEILVAA